VNTQRWSLLFVSTWFLTGLTAPWSRQSQLSGAGLLAGEAGFIGRWRVHWLRSGFRYVERNSSSGETQTGRAVKPQCYYRGADETHEKQTVRLLIGNCGNGSTSTHQLGHWTWWLRTQLNLDPKTGASQPSSGSRGRFANDGRLLADQKHWFKIIWYLPIKYSVLLPSIIIFTFYVY